MENKKRPCYLTQMVKKCYIIPAILFAAIAVTALVLIKQYNVYASVVKATNTFRFLLFAVIFSSGACFIYLLTASKKKYLTLADSIMMAMPIAAIAYVIFVAVFLKQFTVNRVLVAVVGFFFGTVFMCMRPFYLEADAKPEVKEYSSNNLGSYYGTLFSKFSMFGIICCAAAFICLFYLFANTHYSSHLKLTLAQIVVIGICLIPVALYVGVGSGKKPINSVDALLFSGFISIPIMGAQVGFVTPNNTTNIIAISVIAGLFVFLTVIRWLNFDVTKKYEVAVAKKEGQSQFAYYLKKVFSKYNVLLPFAIAGALLAVGSVICTKESWDALYTYWKNAKASGSYINFQVLPLFALAVVSGLTVAIGLTLSIVNIKSKNVNIADLMITALMILSILSFALLAIQTSLVMILSLCGALIIITTLFICRVHNAE